MLGNWISETTATTGTGTISLGGTSAADKVPFNSQFTTGQSVRYDILDGNNRERGIGTLTTGTPWTLARTTILETLNAGTFIKNPSVGLTLSGSAVVSINAGAEDIEKSVLRFVSPQNYIAGASGSGSSGTQLVVRLRMPFYIGSGNVAALISSFNGWYFGVSDATNYANAYSIVKAAIELDGATSSVPVTFGGGRTKTINAGDVDIQADAIPASAFGLSSIPRNQKMWFRMDYSVATAGQSFPTGNFAYTNPGYPAAVGVTIDPAVFNGGVIDSYGQIGLGSAGGWTSFTNPLVPIILGTFANGDPPTFIGIGDSILNGQNDTLTGYSLNGGFMQALGDTTHLNDLIGGANFGVSGAVGSNWTATNQAKPQAYLKYASYAVEEYGTNEWLTSPGSSLATGQADSTNIWALAFKNGIKAIIRPHLLPRTTSDGVTAFNAQWSTGGSARAFNAWLDGLTTPNVIVMNNNALRVGLNGDNYYQWKGGGLTNTVEGTHPNGPGSILEATDYRNVFQSLAPINTVVAKQLFSQTGLAGLPPSAITVGASPFAYTATTAGAVSVTGGTVSAITLTRNGTVVWNGSTATGVVPVRALDVVTVTYSATPTMYLLGD